MCHVRGALVEGEVTERASSTGMDDSLGDTLMVESVDLGDMCLVNVSDNGRTVDECQLPSPARSGLPEGTGQSCDHRQL